MTASESTTVHQPVADPDHSDGGDRRSAAATAEPDTTPAGRGGAGDRGDGRVDGPGERESDAPARPAVRHRLADAAAVLGYLAAAVAVTGRYWLDPTGRISAMNARDVTLFRWMLAHSARAVTHLENPLLSSRLSLPGGINVMANTSILGLGIPLTPVTLAWGPAASVLVIMVLALAGTATAWYFVLTRYLTDSRPAAFVGAALCGFAPGLVEQTDGHLHFGAEFLVPLILAAALRLGYTARPVRGGVVLGLLIAYQVFIGEEVLFLAALACAVWVVAWAAFRPREVARRWRPFALGAGTALLVALVLIAYPLYVQFTGPGSYKHVPGIQNYGADLASFVAYSPHSLGGDPHAPLRLARNWTELNTFFGWPLLLATAVIVGWLRRRLVVRLAAVVLVVLAVLSLGHELLINDRHTGIALPWALVMNAPLFESVVTSRLGVLIAAAIGVIVTMALTELHRRSDLARPLRVALAVLLAGTLLPLIPRPLAVTRATPVPAALADGHWRSYLGEDEALLPVPPVQSEVVRAMSWSADETLGFKVTHGYILGPDPVRGDGWAQFHTDPDATDALLLSVDKTGQPIRVTDAQRAQARVDLATRNVGLLTLVATRPHADALKATVDGLIGRPGVRVGGTWLWDVNP
ncbi:hypothetical protein ACFFWC_01250 [Plantactinospora siamensis]|uniref:Glycosyl transferase n=1 Tax=Plantactinospora siamensis TaxID=555372 RepID=A0ABV6NU99_9ACTN